MRRLILCCGLTATLALSAGTAGAGWHEFWARTKVDFHRNNAWPEPFQSADRQLQRQSFLIMENNGWKLENTIGKFLFDAETQQLNRAGELKVKFIVTQAVMHRRAVFVLRGDTAEETAARLESVQLAISRLIPEGPLPPVELTDTEPEGTSGEQIDAVTRAFNASVPAPRLPAAEATGPSGGGSTGNGSGK
jgi:hypothetical protein